jgi:hypothetical protein
MDQRRRLLVWWLTGAATLLVILSAFAGYFVISTVGSFVTAHPVGCLPSDFPTYPGSTVREIDQTFAVPGSIAQCRVRMTTPQVFQDVNSFYKAELVSGQWETTAYAGDINSSTITFDRRSHPLTRGLVSITSNVGSATAVEVQVSG